MAKTARITVASTPTLIWRAEADQSQTVILTAASGSVSLGDVAIATGHGAQLVAATGAVTLRMAQDAIYGITASGTVQVDVFACIAEP